MRPLPCAHPSLAARLQEVILLIIIFCNDNCRLICNLNIGSMPQLTGNNKTRGVKVDPAGAMLYWISRDDKKVHRCPLAALGNGPIPLTHPDGS